MEASTLVDPRAIVATEDFVPVVAHGPLEHGTYQAEEDGRKVARCRLYRNLECVEHQNTHEALKAYLKDPRFRIPIMIWIDPEGKEIHRRYGWRRPEEFLSDLRKAEAKVPGPRRSRAEARALLKSLDEALAAQAAQRYAEATAKFEEAGRPEVEVIRREAKAGLESIRKLGEEMLASAQVSLKSGSVRRARPTLELLVLEFPAFDSGRQAAELLKTLPK
ncbi:MAG TPA: hypothetical protein VK661_03600 [Planctomycetota bacterium]|nr:hypothetical protein [Planctomycetota bacterium]